jgi:formylglycine-generating enzyme required for sulfatase activity
VAGDHRESSSVPRTKPVTVPVEPEPAHTVAARDLGTSRPGQDGRTAVPRRWIVAVAAGGLAILLIVAYAGRSGGSSDVGSGRSSVDSAGQWPGAPPRAPSSTLSPTPLPVPLGAPVKFRSELWSLPDEPLLGFVEVPEGQFTVGGDWGYEQPPHSVVLDRYYIGRYEVTVGQFGEFVQSTGHKVDTPALNGAADLPVRSVSWYDAVAYTNWLDERLRRRDAPEVVRSIVIGAGCRVTLPSEAEWEKAARGTDARRYPWGAESEWWPYRARVKDIGGNGQPSLVGSFPAGASPYGLLDMIGNVWEWTRSLWGRDHKPDFGYPYVPNDPKREDLKAPDSVHRVVRGGSFDSFGSNSGATARDKGIPSGRGYDLGFRVAVSCSRS